jgi:hypothetical protein
LKKEELKGYLALGRFIEALLSPTSILPLPGVGSRRGRR